MSTVNKPELERAQGEEDVVERWPQVIVLSPTVVGDLDKLLRASLGQGWHRRPLTFHNHLLHLRVELISPY
jgi:hypothetical protein